MSKQEAEELRDVDLHSIYESYRHWIDDIDGDGSIQDDWWSGHGIGGEFTFDINFVLGYESDDLENTNDFGVWLYYVSPPDYQVPPTGIDVTDQFKAYLQQRKEVHNE